MSTLISKLKMFFQFINNFKIKFCLYTSITVMLLMRTTGFFMPFLAKLISNLIFFLIKYITSHIPLSEKQLWIEDLDLFIKNYIEYEVLFYLFIIIIIQMFEYRNLDHASFAHEL